MLGWLPPHGLPSKDAAKSRAPVAPSRVLPFRRSPPAMHVRLPLIRLRPWILRASVPAVVAAALLGSGLTTPSSGDLRGQIASTRSAAAALRAQIAADSAKMAETADGVARARDRLSTLEVDLGRRTRELSQVQ